MAISTRNLSELPDPGSLEKLSQSIAMLDAIMCPEWEYRYFSFNASWDSSKKERMASMRNGQGDHYFLLFSPSGAILKGFNHEAAMSPWRRKPKALWPGVLDNVPSVFNSFLTEPAFSMDDTTFCVWREGDDVWHGHVGSVDGEADPDGSENLLWVFDGDPETYVKFAADYYEQAPSLGSVRRVYVHEPLSPRHVLELNPNANWEITKNSAQEINYPL
jgi:hypothetical protein